MKRAGYLQASGEEYEKARMRCFVRDDFTCQAHKLGLGQCDEHHLRHLVCHHIKHRINGGTHDMDNLITLCNACHAKIHPHLRMALTQKERVIEQMHMREL